MHISTVSRHVVIGSAGVGSTPPHAVPDANRRLGQVRVRVFDRDDHVTFTSHLQLVAGGRVGAMGGYSTLREAMVELGEQTRGDRPAAAVLERDGRFFGHRLKARDLEQGFRAPLHWAWLEADDRQEIRELRVAERFDRLRALVDGDWTHRFRR